MGAFFTSLQIFIDGNHLERFQSSVLDALTRIMISEGYLEVPSDQEPDRAIYLLHYGGKWLGVYDEATEEQDIEVLYSLGSKLSEELQSAVVSILVHDSDIVNLGLFEQGKIRDNYVNSPEAIFEDLSATRLRKFRGKPRVWKPYFSKPIKETDFRKLWDSAEDFAEDILIRTAEVIDLNIEQCLLGYKGLVQDTITSGEKLCFKLENGRQVRLPIITKLSWRLNWRVEIGGSHELDFSFGSIGAKSLGLSVVLFGPAIEEGFITASDLEVNIWSDKIEHVETINAIFVQERSQSGANIYIAHLAQLKLSKGTENKFGSLYMSAKVKGVKAGLSEISIVAYPHENPQEGQAGFTASVEVVDG